MLQLVADCCTLVLVLVAGAGAGRFLSPPANR
jgi:hypothetical protein